MVVSVHGVALRGDSVRTELRKKRSAVATFAKKTLDRILNAGGVRQAAFAQTYAFVDDDASSAALICEVEKGTIAGTVSLYAASQTVEKDDGICGT